MTLPLRLVETMVGFKNILSSSIGRHGNHASTSSDAGSLGSKQGKDGYQASSFTSPIGVDGEVSTAVDPSLNPGELTFEEGVYIWIGRFVME